MELTIHEFKDTGRKVQIRKVSPMLAAELRRAFPEPMPPMQEVDYGDKKALEANYSHPDYQKALQDYQYEFMMRLRRLIVKRGVVMQSDDWKQEVQELRGFWKEEYGKEIEEKDDTTVFISMICCGTEEDLEELINAITKRSQPTPEAIAEAKDSFPG